MRNNLKARASIALATSFAFVLVALVPNIASAAPTAFCTLTANGTKTSYTLPTDCGGGTLLASGYQNIYLDVTARCSSTSFDETDLLLQLNGDNNLDYDIGSSAFGAQSNSNVMDIGFIPCSSSGVIAKSASSYTISIPGASSTLMDKAVLSWGGDGNANTPRWFSGQWHRASVGAISSITIKNPLSAQFVSGSVITLYED